MCGGGVWGVRTFVQAAGAYSMMRCLCAFRTSLLKRGRIMATISARVTSFIMTFLKPILNEVVICQIIAVVSIWFRSMIDTAKT